MVERQTRRPRTGEARFAAYLEAIVGGAWATSGGPPRRGPTAPACCCRASARASSRWRRGSSRPACRPSTNRCTMWSPRPSGTMRRCCGRCGSRCCRRSSGTGRCATGSSTTPPSRSRASTRSGVARQYCGQLGKQDNCQVAVSLSVANDQASLPIAYRLYLPEVWAADPARRAKAGVPEEIGFETKTAIALDQLRQAREAGIPVGIVLGDAGYGDESDFRVGVADLEPALRARRPQRHQVWPPGQAPLPPAPWSGRGRPPTRLRRSPEHQPVSRQGTGARPAHQGLAQRDLARGQPGRADLALCRPAGSPGAPRHPALGALAGGVAADRVARGRPRSRASTGCPTCRRAPR